MIFLICESYFMKDVPIPSQFRLNSLLSFNLHVFYIQILFLQ